MKPLFWYAFAAALNSSAIYAADDTPKEPRARGGQRPQEMALDDVRAIFKTDIPAHPCDLILGRPTHTSITASILTESDSDVLIEYGVFGDKNVLTKTPSLSLKKGEPGEIRLVNLQPNTRYLYRLSRRVSNGPWTPEETHSFQTQRSPGTSFSFTVQADPHLDYNTDPNLYLRCLSNALMDHSDFHIDLGDTFMTDKHRGKETAAAQYIAQRYYFSQIAHSAPLFLVLGNHDAEAGRWLDGTPNNLAIWANTQRKRYFPNPVPDLFYSGNSTPDPHAGLLQNYYAWEWGDALFVALDPFWYTPKQRGSDDNWSRTLGREQYEWLANTLTNSRAKFRFVFLHHLVGGLGRDARGGTEAASLYEWGGHNPDGTDVFKAKRPGWPMPIHELFVKQHVNIVFHGHDHLFVKQELDGIVYQEVPQPGHPRYDNTRSAEEYGYKSGTLQGSSGHLRIQVDSRKATVDYVRSYLPADETGAHKNGEVSYSYSIGPR